MNRFRQPLRRPAWVIRPGLTRSELIGAKEISPMPHRRFLGRIERAVLDAELARQEAEAAAESDRRWNEHVREQGWSDELLV